jgi:hypothetical protein
MLSAACASNISHASREELLATCKPCLLVQALEGEEGRRARERTTTVLATLQKKRGLTPYETNILISIV